MAGPLRPMRVLIIDDSAIVRRMLGEALREEPDVEVVGGAPDPGVVRDLILHHRPDLVTLDIEMSRMDGLEFLGELLVHHRLPVVIVSSVTPLASALAIEALHAGAIDVIPKPGGPYSVAEVAEKLKQWIRALGPGQDAMHLERRPPAVAATPVASLSHADGLLLIGASTGGTQAIESVLMRLPADTPPILIVQHMLPTFTAAFARWLDAICPMRVAECRGNERLQRGTAYLAPGDFHMVVEARGLELSTALTTAVPVHRQRPAVDVLFESAARLHGVPVVAALLTGMGADGAAGMVTLMKAGAQTIAEAEESCVVFGMPREAIARGGVTHTSTLLAMPNVIAYSFETLAWARTAR